jgi:hypothetical protein
MAKKIDIRVTEVTPENMQDVLDHFSDLFDSGNAMGCGFSIGHNADRKEVWVDFNTGDIDITYPDGSAEKIAGTDPRAKEFWDFFGHGDDGDA